MPYLIWVKALSPTVPRGPKRPGEHFEEGRPTKVEKTAYVRALLRHRELAPVEEKELKAWQAAQAKAKKEAEAATKAKAETAPAAKAEPKAKPEPERDKAKVEAPAAAEAGRR